MTTLPLRVDGLLIGLVAPAALPSASVSPSPAAISDINAVIHTAGGDIAVTLFASKTPLAVANFLNLAKLKYYDGLKFKVTRGLMISSGDTSGALFGDPSAAGAGGPGYEFKDEFAPGLAFDQPGVLAMANSGANTNGSQFFITQIPTPHRSGHFTIFGQVTKGQDVVDTMTRGEAIQGIDVLDPTGPLFTAEAGQIAEWNAAIAAKPIPTPRFEMASSSPGNFEAAIWEAAHNERKPVCTEIAAETSSGPYERPLLIQPKGIGLMLADLMPEAGAEGISVVNGERYITFQSEKVTAYLHNPLDYTLPNFSYDGDYWGLLQKLAKVFAEENVGIWTGGDPNARDTTRYSVAFDQPVTIRQILFKITETTGNGWSATIPPDPLPNSAMHRAMGLGF